MNWYATKNNVTYSNNFKSNDDSHKMQFPQNMYIYIYIYIYIYKHTKFKLTKINEIKELKSILLQILKKEN